MTTNTKQQSRLTGALSLTLAQGLVLILGYATHLWIGRVLGPESYGVYGVVLSLQTIFGLILTLGVPVAISRYVAQDNRHAQSILRQGLAIQTAVAILVSSLMLIASPLLARIMNDSALTTYIAFSAIVVLSQAFYPAFAQFLSGLHRFNKQSLLTAVYAIVKLVGALSLIYTFEVYGAFAGFLVGGIAAGILGWWWTFDNKKPPKHKLPVKAFLSFAGTYVLILVGLQILISLDLFMVKALIQDDASTGYYNAAVTLSRIPYMMLQALGYVLLPSVSMLTKPGQSRTAAAEFISDTIRYLIMLIVPSVALAATTSKTLITLFFSSQYLPAAPALSILMVGLGALAFYLLLTNIVAGAGKPQISLSITATLLVISSIAGYLLIPRYGLVGAAMQTTITGLIGLALLSAYTFRTFSIPIPFHSSFNIIIASIVAVAPTYFIHSSPVTIIPIYLTCGVIYLIMLLVLREVKSEDRQRLASIHPALRRLAPDNDKE